jgi:hypothetical protein
MWSPDIPTSGRRPNSKSVKRPWHIGGKVQKGSLFVISLSGNEDDFSIPFGIGKLLRHGDDGVLFWQWYWNSTDNIFGVIRPGWINPDDGSHYYAAKRKHRSHIELTTDHMSVNADFCDDDAVVHGFSLTSSEHLPASVYHIISDDNNVDFTWRPR